MKKYLLALWLVLFGGPAFAGVSCTLPFNLQNGTTADATQVMANYNALVTCLGNAAAAGINTDITALNGLTTPLVPASGGSSTFLGGTSTGSNNAYVVAATVPTSYSATTEYTLIFIANFTNSSAVNNGAATVAVNGLPAVNIYKQSNGGAIPLTGGEIVAGQIVVAWFDGTEFQINPVPSVVTGWGLAQNPTGIQISSANPPLGFDACANFSLSASVNSNILTINVFGNNQQTPSASNPVLCPFRSATLASGAEVWEAIPTALSINTNATGATLGTTNGVPFRFWLVAFDSNQSVSAWASGTTYSTGNLVKYEGLVYSSVGNSNTGNNPATSSGFWTLTTTVVLGLINCSVPSVASPPPTAQIFPLNEASLVTPTGISSGATSAGTFYAPNGTSISNVPFRILGYVEYANGLTTAGTYASAPTTLQPFGPGIYKPGQPIGNTVYCSGSISSCSITPNSKVNLVRVSAAVSWEPQSSNNFTFSLKRGSTTIASMSSSATSSTNFTTVTFPNILDAPASTSSTSYAESTTQGQLGNQYYTLEEIQG